MTYLEMVDKYREWDSLRRQHSEKLAESFLREAELKVEILANLWDLSEKMQNDGRLDLP